MVPEISHGLRDELPSNGSGETAGNNRNVARRNNQQRHQLSKSGGPGKSWFWNCPVWVLYEKT
eukprot:11211027-Lingulodinium_polyedra.AAC.1